MRDPVGINGMCAPFYAAASRASGRKRYDVNMRTTADLLGDLSRRFKARAALSRATIKELVTRLVEIALRQPEPRSSSRQRRSALPVIPLSGTTVRNVTPQLIARIDDEDDRAKLRRSFGR
jgi:hypothetical protein